MPLRPLIAPSTRSRRATVGLAVATGCLAPLALATPSSGAVAAGGPVATSAPAVVRAVASTPTAADRRIATMLGRRATTSVFGSAFSGTVIDVDSNRVVWSKNGGTGRMPASTTKLITATNALTVFGPDHRFTTTVRTSPDFHTLTLVGAGDPSLSTADLRVLAQQTATAAKAHGSTWARVRFDDYLFSRPSLATGWKAGYVPTDIRWVRALVVDGHHVTDTSRDAASVFAGLLQAQGVRVTPVYRAHANGAPIVARVQGDRLDEIVRQMMLVSDNDHAEALHRLVAHQAGYPATWSGARVAQQRVLVHDGLWIPTGAMNDGSGLSRADRLTSTMLARVVDNILEPQQSDLAVLRDGGLPVSGRTGTLRASLGRFTTSPSKCAAGKVVAKTGSLGDAVALAGYTRGTDGRLKAFAFIVNYRHADLTLRRHVDALAATVTGCY